MSSLKPIIRETIKAFINQEGKRTTYVGMLNLLEIDDFWVNDLWRVAKDGYYYLGDFYSPIDLLTDLFSLIKKSPRKPRS